MWIYQLQLTEWGFRFTLGTKRPKRTEIKTWDERFVELVAYKEEHGNCLVPQNFEQLGGFVHKQRTEYKKFLDGRKTVMTRKRFAKLAEIGFVFEQKKRGANIIKPLGNGDTSEEEDEEDDDDEPLDVNEGRSPRNEDAPWDRYSTGARQG
jgi:hypothetical protein